MRAQVRINAPASALMRPSTTDAVSFSWVSLMVRRHQQLTISVAAGEETVFKCGRWLTPEVGNSRAERTLRPKHATEDSPRPMPLLMPHVELRMPTATHRGDTVPKPSLDPEVQSRPLAHYELTVHTAALGGTTAQVAIQLCGSGGEAVGPLRLGGEGGSEILGSMTRGRTLRPKTAVASAVERMWPFREAGQAVFDFEAPDVGPLKHLRVGHDGGGDSPAWHLDSVELTVTPVPAGDR